MTSDNISKVIAEGKATLGIELGSTRIKAVLIDENNVPIASGNHEWEDKLENNVWTYDLYDVWRGLQDSYRDLAENVKEQYGVEITSLKAIGISAMMHGYLVFDENDNQLVPFRTWRNTITEKSAAYLSDIFNFNIPQRWGIAHLYQAILNKEEHVKDITFMTTLAGYVHWRLTRQKVIGIGDASGLFPISADKPEYESAMLDKFSALTSDYPWDIREILPKILVAGDDAGKLTVEGAGLLDPTGKLRDGIPLCPPEGDAGTGMTATNSIAVRTGNISAGTSVFAMAVLEKELSKPYTEVDMVTTPDGKPVAMIHCNTCTSDLNSWVRLFHQAIQAAGFNIDRSDLFTILFNKALEGDPDCGGLLAFNYYSGEPITNTDQGRPLFARMPDKEPTLANFMRTQLYSALATLHIGMQILFKKENIRLDTLLGHGGFFKTPGVGQKIMATAMGVPVAVMETAGEGGAWGIALLANYMADTDGKEPLDVYLNERVFASDNKSVIAPEAEDLAGFAKFIERYEKGLAIENEAIKSLTD